MAEINDAYEALRRADERSEGRASWSSRGDGAGATAEEAATPPRRTGPPRPRPTRPVTGRVDTTETFRPRNATTSVPRARFVGQPPARHVASNREPPRASDPTGPLERARLRRFSLPPRPSLEAARARTIEFGKFHGHTLGEIAAFEPSYIDWLCSAISRDPDLLAAARVLQADLDRRGVLRRSRPERPAGNRSA